MASLIDGLMSRFEKPSPPAPEPIVIAPQAEVASPVPSPEVCKPKFPHGFPANATIVVGDAQGYTDGAMRGEPYMWCWIGGATWYYVTDYPLPAQLGKVRSSNESQKSAQKRKPK